eukprot:1090821-Pelagomonas_calceolata.AAC.4
MGAPKHGVGGASAAAAAPAASGLWCAAAGAPPNAKEGVDGSEGCSAFCALGLTVGMRQGVSGSVPASLAAAAAVLGAAPLRPPNAKEGVAGSAAATDGPPVAVSAAVALPAFAAHQGVAAAEACCTLPLPPPKAKEGVAGSGSTPPAASLVWSSETSCTTSCCLPPQPKQGVGGPGSPAAPTHCACSKPPQPFPNANDGVVGSAAHAASPPAARAPPFLMGCSVMAKQGVGAAGAPVRYCSAASSLVKANEGVLGASP